MSPTIEFRNISVAAPAGHLLLDTVSFKIEAGSTTAVLGRSGSGKSTLLRTVNRMVDLSRGEVLFQDEDIRRFPLITLRRGIGYVVQETGLFPHFTVERNIGIVMEARGRSRKERKRRSHELLDAVGMDPSEYAQRRPNQLSGGQRQRVGLARAMAADPAILLLDEPFGALDPLTRSEMQDLLRDLLRRMRKTVLLVTHDLDEALYLAHNIVLLSGGRVIANVRPQDFMRSRHPEVRSYIRAYHRAEPSSIEETHEL